MDPGKIILVIDDDEDFQTILKVTLVQNGFQVRSIFDGAISTDTLHEQPFPDVILLDIDLPYVNGVEVSKQLKSNQSTKDIPAGSEILVSYGKEYWDVIKENYREQQKEKKKLEKEKAKAKKKTRKK